MRKYLLFVLFLTGLTACENKPSELRISEEVLIPILADLHIAEAAMQHLRGELKDSMAGVYYEQLYEIHNVNKKDFDHTMAILREDPIRLEQIYDKVIDHIAESEAKLKK